jgi:hypothetical protein
MMNVQSPIEVADASRYSLEFVTSAAVASSARSGDFVVILAVVVVSAAVAAWTARGSCSSAEWIMDERLRSATRGRFSAASLRFASSFAAALLVASAMLDAVATRDAAASPTDAAVGASLVATHRVNVATTAVALASALHVRNVSASDAPNAAATRAPDARRGSADAATLAAGVQSVAALALGLRYGETNAWTTAAACGALACGLVSVWAFSRVFMRFEVRGALEELRFLPASLMGGLERMLCGCNNSHKRRSWQSPSACAAAVRGAISAARPCTRA